jgi:structural maintenance of chromosome 4
MEQLKNIQNDMSRDFRAPSNSQRLFDLVKPKEDTFRIAFYFALRNTLVANDIETASKIAYSSETRHRVVTLGGELIDVSGTMSGGGAQKQSGGMKVDVHSQFFLSFIRRAFQYQKMNWLNCNNSLTMNLRNCKT